jgi:hypothetical protein
MELMNAFHVMLIAVLAAPTAVSQSTGEIGVVAKACGAPQRITRKAVTTGAVEERLHYSSLDMVFRRDGAAGWQMSRVSLPDMDYALTYDDAFRAMPCLVKARAEVNLLRTAAPVLTPAARMAATPKKALLTRAHALPYSLAGFAVLVIGALGLLGRYVLTGGREPDGRSGWLCTTCYAVSTLEVSEGEAAECLVCSYGPLVSLDSSEAREYFVANGLKTRNSS